MTLCSNDQISLLAKLAQKQLLTDNPKLLAEEFYLQNAAGDAVEKHGEFNVIRPFTYDPKVNVEAFLPVQLAEAIITFQERCEPSPTWEQSDIKFVTDDMLREVCKTLEGYGCNWQPTPELSFAEIIKNKAPLWNREMGS